MNFGKILDNFINYSFYTLFFLVPLIWLPFNYELFEFNKIILTYFLAILIGTAWAVKIVLERKLEFKRTLFDLALALFLIANVLATIFSWDLHTSLFGYYGRWNGGLLSTFTYIFLFYALVNLADRKQTLHYLYTLLFSSFLISLYAIVQHPNPIFALYGPKGASFWAILPQLINLGSWHGIFSQITWHGIDYNYWAVDVENRVFGTLGQPNWLAAFLSMVIFILISLLFIYERVWQKILFLIAIMANFLAFTFTYSRGGTLGLIAGLLTYTGLVFIYKENTLRKLAKLFPKAKKILFLQRVKTHLLWIGLIVAGVIIINYFWGNAFFARGGFKLINLSQSQTSSSLQAPTQTVLETGGAQTATIRTIVWTGAWEIFKHNPILGTGLETFGYSYYLYRPAAHNLTIEWDYLYNKAHNEYLNYLASSGLIGFSSYLFLIAVFEFYFVKLIVKSPWSQTRLVILALLGGINAYLVQNFFGFSVAPIALLFFLFPAFLLNFTSEGKEQILSFQLEENNLFNSKYYTSFALLLIFLGSFYLTLSLFASWVGDYYYNQSQSASSYQDSIDKLKIAVRLVPNEPLYSSELAINYAGLASTTSDANLEKSSIDQALSEIDASLNNHPSDFSLWQNKKTVSFYLAKTDPTYYPLLVSSGERLGQMAPTDAKTQYNLSLIYTYVDNYKKAQTQLEKVIQLKNDYQEAVITLAQVYQQNKEIDKGIKLLRDWLKGHPSDAEAQNLLKTLLSS